jgi:hypothetical protein
MVGGNDHAIPFANVCGVIGVRDNRSDLPWMFTHKWYREGEDKWDQKSEKFMKFACISHTLNITRRLCLIIGMEGRFTK